MLIKQILSCKCIFLKMNFFLSGPLDCPRTFPLTFCKHSQLISLWSYTRFFYIFIFRFLWGLFFSFFFFLPPYWQIFKVWKNPTHYAIANTVKINYINIVFWLMFQECSVKLASWHWIFRIPLFTWIPNMNYENVLNTKHSPNTT